MRRISLFLPQKIRVFNQIVLISTLHLFLTAIWAQNEVTYPYNPDADADGTISTVDILGVLSAFSLQFSPDGIMVDEMDLIDWILYQDELRSSPIEFVDSLVASGYLPEPHHYETYRLTGALAIGNDENQALGYMSTAMGLNNTAAGNYTHAEGIQTYAFGDAGHAEGGWTDSRGAYGHAQNYRTSTYQYAHAASAAGYHTTADQPHQFVVGRSNVPHIGGSLFVVGNGGLENENQVVDEPMRSDAFRVYDDGNAWVSDTLMATAVNVGGADLASTLAELGNQIQALQATIDSLTIATTPRDACNNEPTFSYQGFDYALVAIEDQCWFAENLQTTLYRDGSEIPEIENDSLWGNTIDGARCVYDNDDFWVPLVGRLYNGAAIEDPRGLCPAGWRVTDNLDWFKLLTEKGFLTYGSNGLPYAAYGLQVDSLDATPWHGSNEYGLNIRPTGLRDENGSFAVGPTTEIDDINKQAWYGLAKSFFDISIELFGGSSFNEENFPVINIYNQDVYSPNWSQYRYYGLAVRCIKE